MAAAQGKTNWFAIGISIAVVVVLVALGGVVVWLNNRANDPGAAPKGEIVNSDSGAISFGEGEDTVAVYVDFMCPICNQFEQSYGEQLRTAAEDGRITLEYHPISILDRFSQGTDYSSRSAGAVFCVAEKAPSKTLDYIDTLFQNQPAENTAGLTDEQLAQYATEVGADAAADCITEGTYEKFGVAQAEKHEIQGTPTVEINGERLDLQNQDDFKKFTDLIS
ncbi:MULTISPECIES: DsbA family protein [Microbacterium]|uniref:DsbA family protein n=1 Tax=Microbacterium TaxID=33882 RepID=UPI00217CEE27|nr:MULTISPECIES: DsbA family protein [Microbacterium]UWF77173.1 thioredoxin domain-containing protein [Microbacterium neungamense]WCM55329.1 thioredoxin domain-containing protein [Microbacterium sp. EF45047]